VLLAFLVEIILQSIQKRLGEALRLPLAVSLPNLYFFRDEKVPKNPFHPVDGAAIPWGVGP